MNKQTISRIRRVNTENRWMVAWGSGGGIGKMGGKDRERQASSYGKSKTGMKGTTWGISMDTVTELYLDRW